MNRADWIAGSTTTRRPRPDWLRRVLATQAATDADVVIGPSSPIFGRRRRPWIIDSGAFAREHFATGEPFPFFHARTSGRHRPVARAPAEGFDDRLALTGGEDRVLFTRMHRAGATFVWDDAGRRRRVDPDVAGQRRLARPTVVPNRRDPQPHPRLPRSPGGPAGGCVAVAWRSC